MAIFVNEMLNLHRGQGQDILWRETCTCPTGPSPSLPRLPPKAPLSPSCTAALPPEESYRAMVLDKTGGLFRLAVGLMQAFSENKVNYNSLLNSLGLYFQIRDDYVNISRYASVPPRYPPSLSACLFVCLSVLLNFCHLLLILPLPHSPHPSPSPPPCYSPSHPPSPPPPPLLPSSITYMQSKSFCEDLTEGKFSFPIIHAIHSHPEDSRLLNILRQRTSDERIKRYAVEWMIHCNSLRYTRDILKNIKNEILNEIERLGGHEMLVKLVEKLDDQLDREEAEFESQIMTLSNQPLVTTL
jgi:geranylgeranyl pyrophosphate synthase